MACINIYFVLAVADAPGDGGDEDFGCPRAQYNFGGLVGRRTRCQNVIDQQNRSIAKTNASGQRNSVFQIGISLSSSQPPLLFGFAIEVQRAINDRHGSLIG